MHYKTTPKHTGSNQDFGPSYLLNSRAWRKREKGRLGTLDFHVLKHTRTHTRASTSKTRRSGRDSELDEFIESIHATRSW